MRTLDEQENYICFLVNRLDRKQTYPTRQQICNVLMEDDQTLTSTAGIVAAPASYSEKFKTVMRLLFSKK